MPDFKTTHAEIKDSSVISIIIGRNGTGKSRFLRAISEDIRNDDNYRVVYISPERAGVFSQDSTVEQAVNTQVEWAFNTRNSNQSENFRKISATYLKNLEISWLRSMERDPSIRSILDQTFDTEYLDKINELLSNVRIQREPTKGSFKFETYEGTEVLPGDLSSGESESITLATEILYFLSMVTNQKVHVLLIDEPDVHLHPDMQAKLGRFITREIDGLPQEKKDRCKVIIATHSTALIAGLALSKNVKIAVKEFGRNIVVAKEISDLVRKTSSFFAHPLSQIIAHEPILIIEGEDDARVLQQAARSSQGKIKVFPCIAVSVDEMNELEQFCGDVLESMYDNPIGYSLRDGDGKQEDLEPVKCIKRFRLQCYAMENVLLTDECLATMDSNWADFRNKAGVWCDLAENANNNKRPLIAEIIASPDRSRHVKIKDARTMICAILGCSKPWEVVVGQTIAGVASPLAQYTEETSIVSYLDIPLLEAIGFAAGAAPAEPGAVQATG
ncbi:AAA domain-containing protein, putative AbiEii toxin, Type IV TA system [Chryseolinea serpens]|uniref:AAA domain-containing protein, putative AbiEii toxin, Type IV TA system n=1 Tax=Chryseolinea serpens TaxID=947013 RepID=A0A1M5TE93_9BACT|nr:AAA family ATPase [Chryseolinea serpens]SHH49001.1 AAA domain-containing protein, putative AbiEii toxin, Type IV TA system [Chryseolinea serpens]